MGWSLIALAGLGCGQGESEPPPDTILPVQKVQLRVELMDPLPEVASELVGWESRQGVEVHVVSRAAEDTAATPPSLREIDLWELGTLVEGREVGTLPLSPDEVREAFLGVETTSGPRARLHAVPWRLDLLALAVPGPLEAEGDTLGHVSSWEGLVALSRRVGPFALDAEDGGRQVGAFLALLGSAGGSVLDSTGAVRLETGPAVEALSFLAQLVQDGWRLPGDQLEAAFATGRAGIVPVDLDRLSRLRRGGGEADLRLVPFPRAGDGRGEPYVLLRPRLLVLPRGGPHADLAADLALYLAKAPARDPDSPILGAGRFLAACRDAPAPSNPLLAQAHALRELGRIQPVHPRMRAVERALQKAVVATLDRRRHPELALADADRELR